MFVLKATVSPGQLTIEGDVDALAYALDLHPEKINLDLMNFDAPFQLKRRGVETKILVGGEAVRKDETLMRSIALGHSYLDLIKAGNSYTQVAKQQGSAKRVVQFLVEFSFLAPDIVEAVFCGDATNRAYNPVDQDQQVAKILGCATRDDCSSLVQKRSPNAKTTNPKV